VDPTSAMVSPRDNQSPTWTNSEYCGRTTSYGPSLVLTTTALARQSDLQSVHQSAIRRIRGTLGGRKIGASDLYLQNVNSLRHTGNDSAFDIRRIRNPADCRMIDSNPGAGIDDAEATRNKSASSEGINVSIWAN